MLKARRMRPKRRRGRKRIRIEPGNIERPTLNIEPALWKPSASFLIHRGAVREISRGQRPRWTPEIVPVPEGRWKIGSSLIRFLLIVRRRGFRRPFRTVVLCWLYRGRCPRLISITAPRYLDKTEGLFPRTRWGHWHLADKVVQRI